MNTETNNKLQSAEITLSYKGKVKPSERIKLATSQNTADLLRTIFDADLLEWREEMILLCLNRMNKVIGYYKVSSGGVAGTVCDPKIIFTVALNCGATSIILSHNHPSGNLKPSQADIDMTKRIKAGGKILDIEVLDHVIITAEGYYSFADEGMM